MRLLIAALTGMLFLGLLQSPTVASAAAAEIKFTYKVPLKVIDGKSVTLKYRLLGPDDARLAGESVSLFNNKVDKPVASAQTDSRGWVKFRVQPNETARWWVVVDPTETHGKVASKRKRIRIVPPGKPVNLPGPAPRIKLPPQPKAVLPGVAVRISPIPDNVWASMQGRSWREGCMARGSLRFVQTNYWAYDGYRRQGQLIVAASAAGQFKNALTRLYKARLPIRSMYLVDRFGYSARLNGADDYKSMAAGNTSAFNCRNVVGRPGVRSPHSSGRSFDINPWENPYASSHGWVPNSYWVGRSHPRVAWRSGAHPVVRALRASGFSWTYGVRDAHHFDA